MPIVFLVFAGGMILILLAITGKAVAETASNVSSDSISDVFSKSIPLAMTDGSDSMTPIQEGDNSITTDPESWPSGDKIWNICRAIAIAEGYNVPGSVPFTLNNPGDISDGADQYGSQSHSGSNVTTFPDAATGWNWLYSKIKHHVDGQSTIYPQKLTITQFAQKYAGNWSSWKVNVGRQLSVNPDVITFAEYVNS